MTLPSTATIHTAVDAFTRAAAGTGVMGARAAAADAATSAIAADGPKLHELARSLVTQPPATWSQAQWGTLDALVAALGSHEAAELPTAITGVRALGRIVRGAARGEESRVAEVGRYMQAWEARLGSDSAATSTAIDVAAGSRHADAGWQELRRIVDADPSRFDVLVPELRAKAPDAVRRAARGDVSATARRIAAALDTSADPSLAEAAARRELALTVLRREVDEVGTDEWRRVAAVVDLDIDRAVRGPVREVEDLPDLARLAATIADGTRPDRATIRSLDAWRLVVDGTSQDPARMKAMLTRTLGELRGGADMAAAARRMRALLDVDAAAPVLTGPRRLAGAPEFTSVLGEHAASGGQRDALERYLAAWEHAAAGTLGEPAALRAAAHELVARPTARFDQNDWKLLARLADQDANGTTLRVPMLLDDGEPIAAVAMRAAHGKPVPTDAVERLLDTWRIGTDPLLDAAALRGRLESLVAAAHERRPIEPSGWRELAAVLRLGTSRHGVPMPAGRTIDRDMLAHVDELARSTGRAPRDELLHTLDAWHVRLRIADGTIEPTAELRTLVSPADGRMDAGRWRGVAALLDAIDDGSVADVPVPQQVLVKLRREANRARAGASVSDDTARGVLDDARHALDPTWISERRAAAWAMLEGGRADARVDANLLRSLDPHAAMRSPFERLAIDAAAGAFPADSLRRGRELVTRVLELPHAPANMPDSLAPVWDDMRRLAEVNMERLNGRTPRGEVRGYSTHPDYAQLGRIKADIELIRRMTPTDHPIAATPPPQAADAAEQLAW